MDDDEGWKDFGVDDDDDDNIGGNNIQLPISLGKSMGVKSKIWRLLKQGPFEYYEIVFL